jgi:muramoyltetrapeptide carboxypeptidase
MAQTPPYLKQGDTITIVATARKVFEKEMQPAIIKIKSWGFNVILADELYAEQDQYAGNDALRTAGLQKALDDDQVKAVIIARGGYGTLRIINNIDFSHFRNNPKWIVGYSDVTVLHSHIHTNFGIETIHATMPINFPADGSDNNATKMLRNALTGEKMVYNIPAHPMNNEGNAEGILTGGNLSLLYALNGSCSDIDTKGKILFIEDLDEYLYHIDRMILCLKRAGKLSGLAGLIVGSMTEMKDNAVPFGKTAYDIIAEAVKEYNYPVCYGFPAGHIEDNRAMILGREAKFRITNNEVIIELTN